MMFKFRSESFSTLRNRRPSHPCPSLPLGLSAIKFNDASALYPPILHTFITDYVSVLCNNVARNATKAPIFNTEILSTFCTRDIRFLKYLKVVLADGEFSHAVIDRMKAE
ncbi:hypothetical protein GWI33_010550 [Rhynchophorus ferrugineus]|uniref:Uncharacterized protein n=1 Tax=Rhynchophorus ferrugineus TaxID=354439 RepID=A0A834MNF0_RHYFE|nr:hypothetical protein GWI33_010550 [Rhynchophorus ferrugineus]